MDKHLHIVSFDVPFPADYGGVIDVFYKLVALHHQGIHIHLHCFTKGRPPQPGLLNYCTSINYYQRKTGMAGVSLSKPYIVQSRSDKKLLENLLKDDYPILLEGIHSSFFAIDKRLAGRTIFIRMHNAEFNYYAALAKQEKSFFKRWYFLRESKLLRKYEARLAVSQRFLAISETDEIIYRNSFQAKQVQLLPAFVPADQVSSETGMGLFCLYHGNLAVNENEQAVEWLLEKVFSKHKIAFVIAGKAPSPSLLEKAKRYSNVCVIENPGEAEMNDLVQKAQVHVLPSFNHTGVKLKLLKALFNGRFCISDDAGVEGSGLESLCVIANDADSFRQKIQLLMQTTFTDAMIKERQLVLSEKYNNEVNARRLIAWLY